MLRSKNDESRAFVTAQYTGELRRIRVSKRKHKCSSPKRICKQCASTVIHPNSENYERGVCKLCELKLSRGELLPRQPEAWFRVGAKSVPARRMSRLAQSVCSQPTPRSVQKQCQWDYEPQIFAEALDKKKKEAL